MDLKSKIEAVLPQKHHALLYNVYFNLLPLRAMSYRGNKVICPCCDTHLDKFLPAKPGTKLLSNRICPRCDSWPRHRGLFLYLKNRTNFFKERLKVLHIAPKYCFLKTFTTKSNLDYISADLSSPIAREKMDITDIPYKDNYFDVILCNHVLEHITDDFRAMQELFRVLKPNGWSILQVPLDRQRERTFEDHSITSPQKRERLFGQHDHVRMYGRDYKDRLEQVGFTVKLDSYLKNLNPDLTQRHGLNKKEDIYLCTKS